MAKYTPRAPRAHGRNFSEEEKRYLDELWDTDQLRGVGKYYTPIISRVAKDLGRSTKEIQVSELCIMVDI